MKKIALSVAFLLSFSVLSGLFISATPVSALTCDSATLTGTVFTGTPPARARFTYSADFNTVANGQGIATPVQQFNNEGTFPIQQFISGLSANTTYHYRLEVTNDFGTEFLNIENFTTPSCGGDQQQPTVSISADDTILTSGTGTTIRWNSTNADSCTASGGANSWAGNRLTSGSFSTGSLTNSVTYSITCSNGVGSNTDSVTITVGAQSQSQTARVQSCTINAPSSVRVGGQATWTVTSVNSDGTQNGKSFTWSGNDNGVSFSGVTGGMTPWQETYTYDNVATYQRVANFEDGVSCSRSFQVTSTAQQTQLPTVDLNADNNNVAFNTGTTLRWTSANATSCSASGGTNGWSGSKNTNSSFATGNLTNTVTYNITCTNSAGSASDSVTVTVNGQNNNQRPTVNISADDTDIRQNDRTVIRWSSSNANSCNASGGRNNWSGSRNTFGSFNTGSLSSTVTYTITCTNNFGSASDSVTVNVSGQNNGNVNVDIRADDTSLAYNSSTIIRWTSSNANNCDASGGANNWRNFNPGTDGSFNTGRLTDRVTFTITCYNNNNSSSDTDSITINVSRQNDSSQQPTVNLTADQNSVNYGGSTIIRWTSSNAASCFASGGSPGWQGYRGISGSFNTGPLYVNTTYYIACSNSSGTSVVDSVTISVSGQPIISSGSSSYAPPATSVLLLASAIDVIGCKCQNIAGSSDYGNEVLYTVTYQNTSNSTAKNLVLRVNLPPETNFVSSAPYNANVSGSNLTFNLGNVAPNSQGAVMIRARGRDGMASNVNVTFNSNLTYTGPGGQSLAANDSVSAQLWNNTYMASANNNAGPGIVASAVTAGYGLLNTSGLLGWLLLIVLVLLITVLVRHLLNQSREKKTVITTTP